MKTCYLRSGYCWVSLQNKTGNKQIYNNNIVKPYPILEIYIPHCKPVRNIIPKTDISVLDARSTSRPVRSANSCNIKSFLDTPPSTLE